MEAIFKRVVFTDRWINLGWGDLALPQPIEFRNYALGWKFEASPRELRLIEVNRMFGHSALTLRGNEVQFTFAMVLGPEFIPEVNPSPDHLTRIEGHVRGHAVSWTRFFASMADPTL